MAMTDTIIVYADRSSFDDSTHENHCRGRVLVCREFVFAFCRMTYSLSFGPGSPWSSLARSLVCYRCRCSTCTFVDTSGNLSLERYLRLPNFCPLFSLSVIFFLGTLSLSRFLRFLPESTRKIDVAPLVSWKFENSYMT